MAQQALWIRENMIHNQKYSPSKLDSGYRQNNNRRPLTEAEIKVKRSLEKLSIPEWYLNKSSKPPKIMMHDTPIDTRLPSWRTGTYKNKNVSSSPILNNRKLSGTTPSQKTPTVDRKPDEKKVSRIINRMDTWQIQSPAKTPIKYTQSYPKISPSRKIKNINIVFSTSSEKKLENSQNQSKNDSELIVENSLYESSLNESGLDKSVRVTNLDKLMESSIEQSFNITNESGTNSPTIKNNERCGTPNFPSPSSRRERHENESEQGYSPVSLSSIIGEKTSHVERHSTVSPSSPEYYGALCDSCQANSDNYPVSPQFRYLPGSISFKSRSKLMPIDEDKEENQRIRPKSNASSQAFMNTRKKSTTLEQIVKRKMPGGTGLIQDIIHEFQKKCVKTSNPTFTGGSKKFVKKLVKVLEKSITEDNEETEVIEEIQETPEYRPKSNNSEIINDFDNKSVTSLATISLKDTDVGSGGSEPSSPTLSNSPDYNWSMQVQVDIENRIPKPSTNDKVRWIPLPTDVGLPRTSSALSMKSRSSSRSSSNKSPCISPITEDYEHQHFFGNNREHWSWSYGRNDTKSRRSFGNEKFNAIFDSGYVERTEHSSLIQSFLAEYEASFSANDELDTSANRRLSFGRTPSIFTRPVHV